jgi:hypothetical protein
MITFLVYVQCGEGTIKKKHTKNGMFTKKRFSRMPGKKEVVNRKKKEVMVPMNQ